MLVLPLDVIHNDRHCRTKAAVKSHENTGSVPCNSLTGIAKEVHKPQCWQGNYSAKALYPGPLTGCSSDYTIIYSAFSVVKNFMACLYRALQWRLTGCKSL